MARKKKRSEPSPPPEVSGGEASSPRGGEGGAAPLSTPRAPLVINTLLVGLLIGIAMVVPWVLRPWWGKDALLGSVGTVIVGGYGFVKWIAEEEIEATKKTWKNVIVQRRTRWLAVGLLSIEAIVGIVLFATRPHLVRIIPGSALDRLLGAEKQVLHVTVYGHEYTLSSPQKNAFYAGCSDACAQYYFDHESKDSRDQILHAAMKEWDPTQEEMKGAEQDFERIWFGRPVIMSRSGAVKSDGIATLVEDRKPHQFTLAKLDAGLSDGVETYVAK